MTDQMFYQFNILLPKEVRLSWISLKDQLVDPLRTVLTEQDFQWATKNRGFKQPTEQYIRAVERMCVGRALRHWWDAKNSGITASFRPWPHFGRDRNWETEPELAYMYLRDDDEAVKAMLFLEDGLLHMDVGFRDGEIEYLF
jgi:hypothetical protein